MADFVITCHRPRRRTIQYAGTYRFYPRCLGVLDAPPSRGMTAEACRHSARTLSSASLPIAFAPAPQTSPAPPTATAPIPPRRAPAGLRRPAALGLRRQRRVVGVADRDQHVADKTVAADALDRRFRKQRAKRGVVEPRQLAKRRRAQFRRARRAWLRGLPAQTCSTGTRRDNRRSHRCGCRCSCEIRAGSDPCSRSSDTKCSAAHRACRARGTPRSGRSPGRHCRSRNDRCRPHRAAGRMRKRSRRETAMSRIRARPDWCACPASPVPPPAPAAFPSRRRYR